MSSIEKVSGPSAPSYQQQDYDHERNSISSARPQPAIQSQPFAGRLAGNQQFVATPTDHDYDAVTARLPDAAQDTPWSSLLSLAGFRSRDLYRLATIEAIGTLLQVFIGGLIGVGLGPTATETSVGPVFPVTYAALTTAVLVALFIYAAGPVTGAHFNPLITLATFSAGLASLPRTALYVLFQCAGGVIGAFLLRAALGLSPEQLARVPGCYVDAALVSPAEAFVLETVSALFALFTAFGLGLDPRNATALGPAVAPIFTALNIFAGGIAREGYLGSSTNPARCLGLMSAAQRFDYHYIHWAGDICAVLVNAFLYWQVPPYVKEKRR